MMELERSSPGAASADSASNADARPVSVSRIEVTKREPAPALGERASLLPPRRERDEVAGEANSTLI